jgi:hypothetical protein
MGKDFAARLTADWALLLIMGRGPPQPTPVFVSCLIEELFGEEVAAGEKAAGLHPPEASASLLARFLRQPWRGSDEK